MKFDSPSDDQVIDSLVDHCRYGCYAGNLKTCPEVEGPFRMDRWCDACVMNATLKAIEQYRSREVFAVLRQWHAQGGAQEFGPIDARTAEEFVRGVLALLAANARSVVAEDAKPSGRTAGRRT